MPTVMHALLEGLRAEGRPPFPVIPLIHHKLLTHTDVVSQVR